MADLVSFSEAMFSCFLDDERVNGPKGVADFAAEIHEDAKEAKAEVRIRWFEMLHKMGIEFDSQQSGPEGPFDPAEAEQRMIAAVLEQIQYSPEVAEQFLGAAVKLIATLPDSDTRLLKMEQAIASARATAIGTAEVPSA